MRTHALDWRDSARPTPLRHLMLSSVSYSAVGTDGFRIETAIEGSRLFSASVVGTVRGDDSGSVISCVTAISPPLANAVVGYAVAFGSLAAIVGLWRWPWTHIALIPVFVVLVVVVPDWLRADAEFHAHSAALNQLIRRAARPSPLPATP